MNPISVLSPPETVRGMTVLDKSRFIKEVSVPILIISPNVTNLVLTVLKVYLLKLEKFKPIQDDGEKKIVFLNPDVVKDYNYFSDDIKACFKEIDIVKNDFRFINITLNYDNWKAHDIISAVLPTHLSFSGYSIIGHIIHVNLKDELLKYDKVIGEVLLEKTKICKSVVNKITRIDNTFRNFEMKLLAGIDDLKTSTRENGCRYELNFADVYWNPRLHEEHGRIISLINQGDVLYDVFCGIGPFAIPAAKKGCMVFANDLNSSCCRWLRLNSGLNKVTNRLTIFNKCGKEFINVDFRENYLRQIYDVKNKNSKFHIIMNLPAAAYQFLLSFKGLFLPEELSRLDESLLPIVHIYCFVNGANKRGGTFVARKLIEDTMDSEIPDEQLNLFHVRKVSPNKDMIRVSFTLMKNFLIRKSNEESFSRLTENAEDFYVNPPNHKNKKQSSLVSENSPKKMKLD